MKYKSWLMAVLFSAWFTQSAAAAIEISSDRELAKVSEVREDFETSLDLHRQRKVGVGIAAGGPTGTMGAFLQMHFALDVGINVGYGFGRGFNSFNVGFRNFLSTGAFNPYWGVSYARWTGRGENLENSGTNSLLSEKFLSETEKRTGEFSEDLIYPSFGLQIYKMSGDWAGAAIYAEINYLIDMQDLVAGATGGLGFVTYF